MSGWGRSQQGGALGALLWAVAVIGIVAALVTAYAVVGPRPTDFAGGTRVPLPQYQAADPSGVPAELRQASLVERGAYLASAADCMVCHTAKDGVPYAGGRAFVLPFGTLYSTNITSDPETGIGRYTDAQFLAALHQGVGRNGTRLYAAMPYASYTYMSDADGLAIKAYLLTLPPVHAPAPANSLTFPFNQRALMGIWALLFDADKRFEPDVGRSATWNRGAYLVEAMGHCGECHTPRNLFFALDNRRKFAGALQAGWRAYNITPDPSSGVGTWSDADLAHYLSLGHADGRGTASGPMGEAVDASLSRLLPADIEAMVAYLRSVPAVATPDLPAPRTDPVPAGTASMASDGMDPRGVAVYEGACAGCHGWTGVSPVLPLATLTGTRAVNDPTATNVAQIVIGGAQRHPVLAPTNMPAFGRAYSDAEIASVANYVTARFGAKGSDLTAAKVAELRALD
jgi:mono/diheme cytochrome c family protein